MTYSHHHVALSVIDLAESVAFYEKLGYEQVHTYSEEDGSMDIIHLKLGDSYLELFSFPDNERLPIEYERAKHVGLKHIALAVDDIDAAFNDMKEKGLLNADSKVTVGKTKVSFFFIKDPSGIWIEFIKDERY